MRLEGITVDCLDKHRMAEFWCAVLGTTVRGEAEQYLGLKPVAPDQPRLVFQQVAELAQGRSRLHLDLEVEDLDAETARVVALGATLVQEVRELGTRWHVMSDPEGNLFCLITPS